jgi:hypothetical protein
VKWLADEPAVARLQFTPVVDEDVNRGEEIRVATQIKQYLTFGFDGERPSGKSQDQDMRVVVIDTVIDQDHPAWNDDAPGVSPDRLGEISRYNATTGNWAILGFGVQSALGPSHGTIVSGQLIADLIDGQDSNVVLQTERLARTGMTPESAFKFIEHGGASPLIAFERALVYEPDVINYSITTSAICDTDDVSNNAVDIAYLADVFVSNSPENAGFAGGVCTVEAPGTAAGSFTVNGTDITAADLGSAAIYFNSARGGDVHGRPLIDVAAPAGRAWDGLAEWNNTYTAFPTVVQGVSLSVPVVSGAVANLKDNLVANIGAAFANEVGNLYSTMLLMGDSAVETGSYGETTPVDELWGVGRLKMRLFTGPGMDAPWRARWCTRTISHGEIATCTVNPDGGGVNQPLSSDVDQLKAAAWWYEPNVWYNVFMA